MTFYEAALRVLESEGRPLHFLEITQKSVAQNLLSHVGKTPEQTMLSRLAAMARRARDRRVCVTAKDTFALIEWGLPEDVEALSQTGIPEPNPEEDLPPLRPVERHRDPRTENARAIGRGAERKGRRDEEEGGRRRKKYPPIAEVVFEILSESTGPLRPEEIASRAREKELASDELSSGRILTALLEDNQRRIDAGRRPQFALDKASGQLSLERAGTPSEAPPVELISAFAEALGIPLEGGRAVLPRLAAPSAAAAAPDATLEGALATAKTAAKEYRRAMTRHLRKRLSELEPGVLEKSVVKMLHGHGFRELKVAKRSKDGPLLTARRRDGSVEFRYAVRILRGNGQLDRKEVKDLRRDLQHYAAQIGLLCTPGEARSDARTEAQSTQGGLVLLWAGDALAEKFLEAKAGVRVTQLELYDVDEQFFAQAKVDAEEAARRREERHRDREQRGDAPRERPEPSREEPSAEGAAVAPTGSEEREAAPAPARERAQPPEPAAEGAEDGEGDDGDDGEEGDEHLDAATAFVAGAGTPGAEGQPGERKRRRRRRRGRRGRGPRADGQPGEGAPGAPAGEGAAAAAPAEGGGGGSEGGGGQPAAEPRGDGGGGEASAGAPVEPGPSEGSPA